jgi:glycerol-3-phosphate acyltransferase PlsY
LLLLLLSGIVGYLIGAFPTGVLVTRLWGAPDLRRAGSGHIGGTNTYRQAGLVAAALVSLVDLFKGVAAVLLGLALTGNPWALPIAGTAAVVGHCWSIYIGFWGGMGLAAAGGIFLWLLPLGPAVFAVIWLVARALLRRYSPKGTYRSSWAVMVGLAMGAPVTLLLWRPPPPVTAYTLGVVAVLLVRHVSELHHVKHNTSAVQPVDLLGGNSSSYLQQHSTERTSGEEEP